MAATRPSLHASTPSTSTTSASPSTSGGFAELGVPTRLVRVLAAAGIDTPFPIQASTLPDSLAGRDVLGRGRTGSGKTYAFLLPLVARLVANPKPRQAKRPRALVLAPTRELVRQIEASLAPLAADAGLRVITVFGGVSAGPQVKALQAGVDVVIACPGRLADHMQTRQVSLDAVEVTVLDEADHMADLGFLPVVRRILDTTPRGGQRLLFSATLDAGVDVLVKRFLTDPVVHSVDSAQSPVSSMDHHVLHVGKESRLPVIANLAAAPGRTMVFTRTKHGAKNLTRQLNAAGVATVELHGNLSQNARTRNLTSFSSGAAQTLVATDIAARGIHVDDVALVVHADPPVEHKAYLHRSGRTARAGSAGTVVTIMLDSQTSDVRDLTRKAGVKPTITRVDASSPMLTQIAPGERVFGDPVVAPAAEAGRGRGGMRGQGGGQGGQRGQATRGARQGEQGAAAAQDGQAGRRSRRGGRAAGQGATAPAGQRSGGRRQGGQTGGQQSGQQRSRPAASSTRGSGHSAAGFSSGSRRPR